MGAETAPATRRGRVLLRLLGQPINRLLVVAFTLVSLLLLAFLSWQLYHMAWRDAWREINEKHRLLALNMAAPVALYVHDHQQTLALLGDALGLTAANLQDDVLDGGRLHLLEVVKRNLNGFRSVSLLARDGRPLWSSQGLPAMTSKTRQALVASESFAFAVKRGQGKLSGIAPSPFDGHPGLLLGQPLRAKDGTVLGVLLGELSVAPIEALRQRIHFGEKGHSAIVDQYGRVIAHPNPDWMRQMRDLSHLNIVQAMMAGRTGVTEFYSPFVKQDMVAGYTAVPDIGWGIMVPQPKAEVAARVSDLLLRQLYSMLLGLALAIILAFLLAGWITRPLKRLAQAASALNAHSDARALPLEGRAPREVRELSLAMRDLVSGLNDSYRHIDTLNRDLQHRVTEATEELQRANNRLSTLAAQDHLTGLANRRHFEQVLSRLLQGRRTTDGPLCLILVDVDEFKGINDQYGHAAGDAVLVWLAELLGGVTREADLLARYAGDEFVLCLACALPLAQEKADRLVRRIAERPCPWNGQAIPVTVSVGVSELTVPGASLDEWFPQVDRAMYRAKEAGRNRTAV